MSSLREKAFRWGVAAILALLLAGPASAVPVTVMHADDPRCDTLDVPYDVDELGNGAASAPPGPFPPGEEILSSDVPTLLDACTALATPGPNTLVSMTNLTGVDWAHVWYVSDPETFLSNYDGFVNGEEAFKIDSVGSNVPLVFESMIADDIFQAGETWNFIIDNYVNGLGLNASLFRSCLGGPPCTTGLVGNLSVGDVVSSGSIIVIPEPATFALLGFGLLALLRYGRRWM